MTSARTAVPAAPLVLTFGLAAAAWVIAVRRMDGMDMRVATELGSFEFFVAAWASMMAAMMLPGAVPAVSRRVRVGGRTGVTLLFLGSYVAVWTLVGLAVYALYRPHGTSAAGTLVVAAGIYELTPLKRKSRRRCHETVHSGVEYGLYCVGSSVGLMLMLVALGVMSVTWMSVLAVLIVAQKFLAPRAAFDVPLALAIISFGALIVFVPESVPGLALRM